jgi:hypothetical protein
MRWRGPGEQSRASQLRRIARGWRKRPELQKPAVEHELPGSDIDQHERAAATDRLRLARREDEARGTTGDR